MGINTPTQRIERQDGVFLASSGSFWRFWMGAGAGDPDFGLVLLKNFHFRFRMAGLAE